MLARAHPDYTELINARTSNPEQRIREERRAFRMDHANLGGLLLGRWGLPEQLADNVAGHHSSEDGNEVATHVSLADMVAHHGQGEAVDRGKMLRLCHVCGLSVTGLRDVLFDPPHSGGSRRRTAEPSPLSARQTEVLRIFTEGKAYKTIALELGISSSTARSHLQSTYEKLGVDDRPTRCSERRRWMDLMSRGPVVGADGIASPAGVVVECEISTGVPAIAAPAAGSLAFVLVRVFSEPIGMLSRALPARGFEPEELASAIVGRLGPGVRDRVEDSGLPWTGRLPTGGLRPPRTPRFLESREHVLREGPEITVAVCTRDRPEELVKLLESLGTQEYAGCESWWSIMPRRMTVRGNSCVARGRDIEYVVEPRPGLSWARNRAIEACDSEVIAWADDDEVCDRWWADGAGSRVRRDSRADAVTGIVVPVELETQSQAWFEQYSGVRRGRGFARAVFSPATAREQSPMYPLPPYGIGANMAFRLEAIERIGGFDCALGAGTRPWRVRIPQPSVRCSGRRHDRLPADCDRVPSPPPGLRPSAPRDGGLWPGAQRLLREHARAPAQLRARADAAQPPGAARPGLAPRPATRCPGGLPAELLRANRLGLLQGAFVYAGARLHAWRLAGTAAGR